MGLQKEILEKGVSKLQDDDEDVLIEERVIRALRHTRARCKVQRGSDGGVE